MLQLHFRHVEIFIKSFKIKKEVDMKKSGFTLAEVLVTLGIVGVVAAMTLPTVIANYQKQVTESKLKKVYTVLNQAFKLSETQHGEYQHWENAEDIGANEYFNKYLHPYMKVLKVCNSYRDCNYKTNTPWKTIKGIEYQYEFLGNNSRVAFILTDGTLINIFVKSGSSLEHIDNKIFVDLNGGEGVNTFGKDVFIFQRTQSGLIQPYGIGTTMAQINSSCSNDGMYCALKIMQDGWKIAPDYPW